MADINTEKIQNDDDSGEKEQENSTSNNTNPYFDTSSSDSDFELEFTCEVCKKTFSGIKPLRQHEKSGQHLKRVRKKEVEKKLAKKLEEDVAEDNEDVLDQIPFAVCKTCKKDFTGPESLEQHLKSSIHHKKMAASKLLKEIQDEDGHINLGKLRQKRKEMRSKKGTPIAVGKTSGNSSPSDASAHSGEEEGACAYSGPPRSDGSSDDDRIAETHEFECLECKKVFTGVSPWYQHLISKVHEKSLRQKELFDHLKIIGTMSKECSADQYLVQEDDDVILCKLCNVAFSGPESASSHLKSKKHTKNLELKKWKNAMKEERKEKINSSKMKKKASFESSGENNSEMKNKEYDQETTGSKTDLQENLNPAKKDTYVESSNATGGNPERKIKPDQDAFNDDKLQNEIDACSSSVNEEIVNQDKFNFQSFKETCI
ncbi:zinc finger protein 354A-like [Argiope bruennichi]|uniref:zinc finger protein 354A-like n=1 Tax=Argiope bruennichi TaxID=94029 RepID=UPI002494581B|nr:zinc finger protein 354A-like [Argiope bruennichi]XP_055940503.1 zinc finger protein 354A-like [Argiope bruennichi]